MRVSERRLFSSYSQDSGKVRIRRVVNQISFLSLHVFCPFCQVKPLHEPVWWHKFWNRGVFVFRFFLLIVLLFELEYYVHNASAICFLYQVLYKNILGFTSLINNLVEETCLIIDILWLVRSYGLTSLRLSTGNMKLGEDGKKNVVKILENSCQDNSSSRRLFSWTS